ncbi:MAG: DUF1178 family protein [Candidatus Binatia bacterium]
MVVYDLVCQKNHRFEGWFPSAEGYEEQASHNQISCPVCGVTKVAKLPHACAIRTKREEKGDQPEGEKAPSPPLTKADVKETLLRLHHYVRENFEDVGPLFAEEARKIFYGKVKKRPIHGTVTAKEREELDDDGIPHVVLPKPELDS